MVHAILLAPGPCHQSFEVVRNLSGARAFAGLGGVGSCCKVGLGMLAQHEMRAREEVHGSKTAV